MIKLIVIALLALIFFSLVRVFVGAVIWANAQISGKPARGKSPVTKESQIFQDDKPKAKAKASSRKVAAAKQPARKRKAAPAKMSAKHKAWLAAERRHKKDQAFYETLESPAYLRRGLVI